MLEFLVSLMLLLLTFNSQAARGLENAVSKLEQNFPASQSLPSRENPLENRLAHPPQSNNTQAGAQEEKPDNDKGQASINNNSSNQPQPDTNKSQALNNKSGKVIESVANVAIEKSPALEPYANIQAEPTPTPTPIPTPTPSQTISKGLEPIDPPIEIPKPPVCKDLRICPQIYCLDQATKLQACSCECGPLIY